MDLKRIKIKDKYFTIFFEIDENRSPFDIKNYKIVQVEVVDIDHEKNKVLCAWHHEDGTRSQFEPAELFSSEYDAKIRLLKVIYDLLIDAHIKQVKQGKFPVEILKPNFKVKVSGNPLRMLERNIVFGPHTNVFGTEINAQKLIQMLGISTENCLITTNLLNHLMFLSDYVKKYLASMLIIEFNNIFILLKKISEMNSGYRDNEYADLEREIESLEKRYNLRDVRNRIVAHRCPELDLRGYFEAWNLINSDVINEYWKVFINHIHQEIRKYYLDEYTMYIGIMNKEIKGAIPTENKTGYTPFNEFEL